MKPGIHPDYHPVLFQDHTTGDTLTTGSTATSSRTIEWSDGNTHPLISIYVSAASRPFRTGKQRVLNEAGQVEKFCRRYASKR
jgi:large subunit ribosomal protein L31